MGRHGHTTGQKVGFFCDSVLGNGHRVRTGRHRPALGQGLQGLCRHVFEFGGDGLGLIGQVDEVLHLAEFGVVFLLFIIGLEMQPRRLWALRKAILGLGGLQVVATSLVLGVAAHWVMGLPFVPGEVIEEERAFARFAGGCVLCTTIEAERSSGDRVVFENDEVMVLCPYWSGTPYELLVIPQQHLLHLQDTDDATLAGIGRGLRDAMAALSRTLGDVAYNVGFHSAPHQHSGEYHWHIHIWPNLVTQAGFERGTGVLINVVPPESAAEALRTSMAAGLPLNA